MRRSQISSNSDRRQSENQLETEPLEEKEDSKNHVGVSLDYNYQRRDSKSVEPKKILPKGFKSRDTSPMKKKKIGKLQKLLKKKNELAPSENYLEDDLNLDNIYNLDDETTPELQIDFNTNLSPKGDERNTRLQRISYSDDSGNGQENNSRNSSRNMTTKIAGLKKNRDASQKRNQTIRLSNRI